MGNRISTEDLYKITQSLADRAVSDVKKRREDERKREEAIKKNREERLAAAAKQNRIPNYKGGSLWDQYKAALASGEAKNANDFITKRDARNATWNKVGAETLNDDMEALAKSISSTYGTQFDPSKYYSQETINGSSDQVKKMRDRLNALAEYYNTYGGSDDQKRAVGEQIKAYDSELKFLGDLGAHYGQYKNEADFNYRTDKRRDEDYIVNDYDAEAGKKNLAELKGYLDRINTSSDSLSTGQLISNARSRKKAYNRTAINEAKQQYGLDGMTDDEVLNWLTQEYQLESFALNNVDRMRTAARYRNLANNEDFLQGVISGKAVENPTFEDYLNYENAATQKRAEAYNKRKASDPILTAEDTKGQDAPNIVNKLRFYEDLTNDKYGNKTDSTTVWSSDLGAAKRDALGYHYGLMTDDEKRVYYYLLGTQGKEAADKYLEDMDVTLDYRNTEEVKQFVRDLKNSKIFGNVSAAALANTFGGLGGAALGYLIADNNEGVNKTAGDIAYSAASVPLNVLGGGISTIGEIGQRLDLASKGDWEGKGYNPYENYNLFSVAGREARGLVAKDIEDKIGWEMFGQNVMSQVYQSLMSGVDSAFGMATLGRLYTISMGGSAAASKAAELYESGASSSQIYWESLLSGIAEATFEYLSIENLSSIRNIVESKPTTLKKAIKMILTQNGIEASEEVFTEIANTVIDKISKGYDSDYDRKVTEYVRDGMTREEAVKKAAGDVAADIGWAGAGGFISGLASSSLTIAGAYRAGKANADAQISAIDPGNAEGLYNNAKKIDYSILNDASEALKKGDAKAAAEIISEGKDWYEYLKSYAKEKYGKNQASEISANIDASIDNLNQIKNLISSGDINADSIQAVLEKAKSAQDTKVDVTSANDEKLFSLLAKGEPSNSVIEKNILKDRGTLAAFERLTGLRIGGTTVSQKRADVREAFKAVSSSTETLKAAQNAIESGATATEGHKNAAVIIDQAIQANRAENSRLRNSEKVKSAETKAAIDATNRQHRFLETARNYVINGGDLSGFTESPAANVSGEGGTNSSETKTTQETAKKRVRADFSAYQDEITATEYNKAVKGSAAEQYTYFSNEEKKLNSDIKNIAESEAMTAEEKAEAIEKKNEEKNRLYALAKSTENVREMMRVKYAGNVDRLVEELQPKLKKYGIKIDVVDNIDAAGKSSSGAYFDRNTNTIKVSRNWDNFNNVVKLVLTGDGLAVTDRASVSFDRAVTQTIAHEIAHADSGLTLDFIKAVAGTQYDAFDLKGRLEHPDDRSWRSEDAQKEKNWRRYVDAYTEQAMLEMKGTEEQRRASAEKVVNDAYIFEEIMADMFGTAVDDMGHSSKAGENIFWAMNRNKPGIIKRILNALERFIARIRGKDAYLAVEQRQAAERLRDMLTGELKRAYGTDVKGEAAVESGGGKRHSLAGANSRTADLNSLGGAYQMYQNGVSMDTIRKRTGWWLGKDGKWRYEISDKEMRFNPDGFVKNPTTVGDYVKHDQLFAAYPWIADIPVHIVDVVTGGSPATNGKYSPDGKFIELKKGLTSEKAKYILSHELQHAIQQAEGFVRGTSPKTGMFYAVNLAYDLVKNNPEFVAESKPQDKMNYLIGYLEAKSGASLGDYAKYYYFQNYGETEARNVSQRLDMTEEERRALPIENNGEVFSYDEVFKKIVDNLKAIGYNKKQIDTILKEGVSYDIEQTDVQTSADEVVKRRRNDREETGRLSDADENGRRPGEIYRTGKIPTAGVSESAEILDSERRNGGLRRGNRGTDSQNGALGAGSEAGKRLNEVSKPEKRFSLSSNVEQTKDLIAVHNMTAAELEKSLDLGGLPMPSIAIIKAADGHSEYGDVSLVFGKDTIDPKKSARNKVYGGDAWTPTFPKIDYKANEKVGKRIRDKYYDLSRKYGYDNTRALYNYAQDLSDVLTSEGGEKAMIDKLYGDTGMMQIYLMDTGRERVANVNKETKTALTDGQVRQYENLIGTLGRDEMNGFAKKDGEELSDLVRRRKAFIEENESGIRKAFEKTFIEDGMSAKDAAEVSAELALSDLRKYVLDTFNYIKNGAETVKTEFDSEATDAAIKKAADGKGYRKWVNDLFGGAEEKSGIRNSKDAYTASGNRRSFEALHWENNLENIVKAMLEQDETGGAFFSGTGIWGVSAKKYNSISEIKNDSSRLRTMNEAEYNALKEQYGARMQEIAQTLIDPKNDNYFIASDDAYSLIVDAVRNSKDESGILRYLKKYNSRATEKTASDIAALVRDIAEMPTGYFEAKPQRAVGFDEVKAVILPDNASGELVSRLESDGINTVTYKAGDENSRLEALNGVENVRFSLTRANDEYMKAVESGNTKEQQRLVDEAAEKWSDGNEVYVTDNETGEAIFKFYRSADDGRTVWDGNGHNQNKGVFLTSNEYIADAFNYGRGDTSVKHITVYAKAENPFRIDAKNNLYTSIPVDESMPEWLQDRASYDTAWSDSENDYIIEQSIDIDNLYPEAFKHGYDAVIVENVKEGVGGGVAADVVLKDGGKQMKSADPITYDNDGNVIPLSERFNSKNNDIRYSLTRANNEYMKAVESGDTEEQRRLVDEAAKANGYDRLFWHGSKKSGGFTEFRDWSYFTENKKYASRYAKAGDKGSLYEVYANLGNAFDTRKPECREIFDKMRSEYGLSKVQESGLPDWTDGYDIAEFIDENGLDYDSIILDEGGDLVDGKPVSRGFSYVIRSSEQVKSADPITYDDSGNVIPLTERFDSGNRDIRWSLAGNSGITTEITDDSYDEYEGGYQRRDIKLNGETVGTVAIRIYDDYSEIDRIDIDEKYRNKGIGTTVLGDIAGEFDTTYIVPDNESAKRLYERIGEEVTSGEVYENLDQGYGVYRLDKSYGNTRWSLAGTNKDGIEVYETSDNIKNLTNKERMKRFEEIMKNDYRGRTAKFIRNGHAYYATFEDTDVKKNIYGDNQSSEKGWKAKIRAGADGDIFELVENAEYDRSSAEQGKSNSAHKGINFWDYYVKTVQIDNEVYDLLANVRRNGDDSYVYNIRLYQNKKIKASPPIGIQTNSVKSGAQRSDNSVSQNDSVVNTQSMQDVENDSSGERHSLVKSAQSELKALQKENEKLRQDVDDLKQELQLTHGRKLSRDALISSIQKILVDRYGVKLSAKELYPHVTNLFDMFYNNTVDGKRLKKDERVDTMRIIEEMDKIVDAVIENAVGVDDTYAEMKKLLPELRNTKLVVPVDERADAAQSAGFENWAEFRKANFGRVGFANEGLPVDSYYMELSERYPELFPDGITHPGEQAAHIADVVNTIRESGINEYQLYDIEDERIRTSIKNDVMDIIGNAEKLQTFADRAAQKAKDKRLADITKLKEKNKERTKKKIAKVRERYAEASKNRTQKQQRSIQEKRAFEQISKYTRLLDKPTTDKHVTEAMRGIMLGLLESVDTVSTKTPKKSADISDPEMSPRRVRSYGLKKFDTIEKLVLKYQANVQNNLENEIEINQAELDEISKSGIVDDIAEWIKKHEGESLADMTLEELTEFNKLFRRIDALSSNIKKLYDPREGLAAKSWQAQKEIGLAQMKERKQVLGAKTEKAREKYEQIHFGALDPSGYYNTLGSDTMTAQFERFRQCQNRFSENIQMFTDRLGEIVDGAIPKDEHGKNAKEVTLKLSHGTLTATPAQLMSIHLMLNQEDSRRCLFNEAGGVIIGKFTAEKPKDGKTHIAGKRTFAQSGRLVLNEADAAKITAALTDGQRKRADAISALLNNEAARLGNEVSMAMYGYKKYTTENYFPMRTADDYRAIADNPNYEMNLLGLSFTKERTGRAGKALVAEDIYDVIGRHLTNMAQYNAFAQELDNAKKMYSLRLGDGTSLKQRIIRSYGREADTFYNKLINNLSGVQMYTNNSAEALSDKLLSNYKAAAVAGNVSVVLKQPMSIFRALPEFSLAGLKKSMAFEDILNLSPKQLKENTAEMLKYSGIARLKAWGSSENMTRKSFESLYNDNSDTARQKINEFLTSGAENADMWTWAKLWRMSKAEIDAQGKYTAGSNEYFEAVDRKFSDVIGKTQVVQSALDSSMAVQNAKGFGKFLFAFQNEPLKQYSYLISTLNDARRGKPGAKKKLAKVIASSLANAAAVSAISTFMAWLRGTLDRDDDDELLDDLMKEFAGNSIDDLLSGAFAPVWQYIDTIMGAINSGVYGNTVERLDMAALTDLGGLINKYFISQNGGRPNLGTVQDIVNVASNLFGLPAKNIFRDVKSVIDRIILELPVPSAAKYNYLKAWKDVELTNKAAVTEAYYDVLRDAVDRGRYSDYVKIKRDMIYHGYTETKIKNAVMKSSLMDDLYELKKVNPGSYKAKVNSIVSSVSAVSSLEGKEFEDFIESAMKRREREDGGSKTDDEVYDEMHRKMEKEVKEQLIYIDVSKRAAYIKKMLKTYGEYGITEADILKVLRKAGKA